jgi:hypothetical protein
VREIQVKTDRNTPTFTCVCGKRDVAYIHMPHFCHWCRAVFTDDVLALMRHRMARVHYYFRGKTFDEELYRNTNFDA